MNPNIKQVIKDIIWKHTQNNDINYFEEIGFTDDDIEKINAIPDGVNDIILPDYCSQNFLDSFKVVIDTHPEESINLILDKILIRLDGEHDTYPINPNKHEFSSVSDTKIIKTRVMKVIEEKYL